MEISMEIPSVSQERLIQIAIDQSMDSEMASRHGCVISIHGKPLSVGTNHYRNMVKGQQIISCHAEIDALSKYMRRRTDITIKQTSKLDIWVVRTTIVNGLVRLHDSRPCVSCLSTLKSHGLRKIWFSTEEGDVRGVKIRDYDETYVTRENERLNLHPCLQLC